MPSHQCFGQHRHVAEDLRQFAIALLVEAELDLAIVERNGLGHVGKVLVVEWTVRLEHVERPDDVLDGDRLAVMPFRPRVETVGGRREIVRMLVGVGQQRVAGARLVGRLLHQRVVEQAAAETREAGGRRALDDIGIEAVETAGCDCVERAALRRVGIDVIVVLEVVAVFRRADQRRSGQPVLGIRRQVAPTNEAAMQPASNNLSCNHDSPFPIRSTVKRTPGVPAGQRRNCHDPEP